MPAQGDPINSQTFSNPYWVAPVSRSREDNGAIQTSSSSAAARYPPSQFTPCGDNYIEHHVSKMDTLAGVAIKYGVEIADVRRMNGLVTDIQMFAHKSLQIPLPGRHPPSPIMSNVSVHNREKSNTAPGLSTNEILHSFQSLKLEPSSKKAISTQTTEMSVFKSSRKSHHFKDQISLKTSASNPPHSRHRKSQSLLNFISLEKGDISIDVTESDKSIRRRPKTDPEPSWHAPEILLKEEGSAGRGNGLALRPKPGSRGDVEPCGQNFVCGGNSLLADVRVSVGKSLANLNEMESGSSVWSTGKWSLKADIVARPIIDGLPKPVSGRRNYKAAID